MKPKFVSDNNYSKFSKIYCGQRNPYLNILVLRGPRNRLKQNQIHSS